MGYNDKPSHRQSIKNLTLAKWNKLSIDSKYRKLLIHEKAKDENLLGHLIEQGVNLNEIRFMASRKDKDRKIIKNWVNTSLKRIKNKNKETSTGLNNSDQSIIEVPNLSLNNEQSSRQVKISSFINELEKFNLTKYDVLKRKINISNPEELIIKYFTKSLEKEKETQKATNDQIEKHLSVVNQKINVLTEENSDLRSIMSKWVEGITNLERRNRELGNIITDFGNIITSIDSSIDQLKRENLELRAILMKNNDDIEKIERYNEDVTIELRDFI